MMLFESDRFEQAEEPSAKVAPAGLMYCQLCSGNGVKEAPVAEGFEQVVQGVDLEGTQRELVVGGDEDHVWHAVRPDRTEHFEPIHHRHLDVQEQEIGLDLLDRGHRRTAIGALTDDLNFGIPLTELPESRACQRLVVYDEDSGRILHRGSRSARGTV
jgi:hypothetical protein